MNLDDRFATRVEHIEETPSPLRETMLAVLTPTERPGLIAFAPAFAATEMNWPATLLAITDRRWILVSADETGSAQVTECTFADTLLVELTTILLKGHLRIDFASNDESQGRGLEFNAVMNDLYLEASHRLLDGIDGLSTDGPSLAGAPEEPAGMFDGWPLKFHNAVRNHVPRNQRLVAATHWPAVYGGFRRELGPARALAVTDRTLLLVSEEPAGPWWSSDAKLGVIVTYFPRRRLAKFHVSRNARFTILDLEVHGSHGGEQLTVMLPLESEKSVHDVMARI